MFTDNKLWGLITGADKHLKYPDQQAKFLGRVGNFTIIYPYGSHCDLPSNVLLKEISEGVAIPVTIARPEGIKQGEPVDFHPVQMSYIVFRNNGDIEIITHANVNVQCNDLNVIAANDVNVDAVNTININAGESIDIDSANSNVTITAALNVDVGATNINLTASAEVDIVAPLTKVFGDFEVTGSTVLSNNVTSDGVNISNNHRHDGVTSGSQNTGQPI